MRCLRALESEELEDFFGLGKGGFDLVVGFAFGEDVEAEDETGGED